MDDPSAGGVENEVEGRGQSEEADEVQGLVGLGWDIWLGGCRGGRQRRVRKQAERGGEDEEDDEGDWEGSLVFQQWFEATWGDLLAKGNRIRMVSMDCGGGLGEGVRETKWCLSFLGYRIADAARQSASFKRGQTWEGCGCLENRVWK